MMMILEWLPWMAIAAIPGLVNIVAAFEELNERCKLLPFFNPISTPGVWVWGTIQFFFPAILFWGAASLGSRPDITLRLLGEAAIFGIGFIAVLNANIRIGANIIPIKSTYTFFINIAYRIIAYNQDDRVYEFWLDVQDALEKSTDLSRGLDFLQEYFEIEVEITQRPNGEVLTELEQIRALGDRPEQARRIKTLLKNVSRKRLRSILKQFQIDQSLLHYYFAPQPRPLFFRRKKKKQLRQLP
ncbi:MAG: hypothetical protein VKL39_17500 [Leptolyngbyaceae bacterium]|nr:hypothetical protein [Leptolyngbyaceae bacterium]